MGNFGHPECKSQRKEQGREVELNTDNTIDEFGFQAGDQVGEQHYVKI
jgi:hypothetical protein